MDKMSIKYQIFTNLCMSDMQFDTGMDMKDAIDILFNYMTEDMDFDEDKTEGSVTPLHTVN